MSDKVSKADDVITEVKEDVTGWLSGFGHEDEVEKDVADVKEDEQDKTEKKNGIHLFISYSLITHRRQIVCLE